MEPRESAEDYLEAILRVKEKQALIDACKVEHDLSEETFKAIQKFIDKNNKK